MTIFYFIAQHVYYGAKAAKLGKALFQVYLAKQTLGLIWPDHGFQHLLGLDNSNTIAGSILTPDLLAKIGNPIDHIDMVAQTGTAKTAVRSIMKIEDKSSTGETVKTSDVIKIIKDECKLSSMLAGGFTAVDELSDRFHFTIPDDAQILTVLNQGHSGAKLSKILDNLNSHTLTTADKEHFFHIVDHGVRDCLLGTKIIKSKMHNFSEISKKMSEIEKQQGYIKNHYLKPKFVDLIQMEKEGKSVEVPNCIMLVGPEKKIMNELIDWTGRNSNCTFVKIKKNDDILEHLEKAEDNYCALKKKSGNRNFFRKHNA